MTKEEIMERFYDACRLKCYNIVSQFLKIYPEDIDHYVPLYKSHSMPELITDEQLESKKLLHSSSESLLSVLDTSGSDFHSEASNLGLESGLFEVSQNLES